MVIAAPAAVVDNFKKSRRFIEILPCKLRSSSAWRPMEFGRFMVGACLQRRTESPPRDELAEILFLHQYGADDNQPLHHQLDIGIDILKLKNVRQQAENQDADEGAGEAASATHQAGAADHHCGDRVEFEPGAG